MVEVNRNPDLVEKHAASYGAKFTVKSFGINEDLTSLSLSFADGKQGSTDLASISAFWLKKGSLDWKNARLDGLMEGDILHVSGEPIDDGVPPFVEFSASELRAFVDPEFVQESESSYQEYLHQHAKDQDYLNPTLPVERRINLLKIYWANQPDVVKRIQ